MTTIFQSVGIVFSILLLIIVTIAIMYLGYIAAIGIIILALLYIVYNLSSQVNSASTEPN